MENKKLTTTAKRKKKAFEYYIKGLNSKEIAKILHVSYRTIQNYMSTEKWKEKRKAINSKD